MEELARRLHHVLDASVQSHELIFVDDQCPEGSLDKLCQMSARDPRITVLALAHHMGQHSAAMTGLAYSRSAWTVILDADLQDPPEAIPRLLTAARPSTAVIFAGRRGTYESYFRLLTSRLFKSLLHLVSGVPRDAGLFVALRHDAVRRLLEHSTDRPFVVAMIGCLGLETTSVPVERPSRPVGHSAYSNLERLRSAWRAFACLIDVRRSRPRRNGLWHEPEKLLKMRCGSRFTGSTVVPEVVTNPRSR